MHMVEAATAAAIARRCMYVAYLLSIHSATDRAEDIILDRSPRYMVSDKLTFNKINIKSPSLGKSYSTKAITI